VGYRARVQVGSGDFAAVLMRCCRFRQSAARGCAGMEKSVITPFESARNVRQTAGIEVGSRDIAGGVNAEAAVP